MARNAQSGKNKVNNEQIQDVNLFINVIIFINIDNNTVCFNTIFISIKIFIKSYK